MGAGHRSRLPADLLAYWADGFDWRGARARAQRVRALPRRDRRRAHPLRSRARPRRRRRPADPHARLAQRVRRVPRRWCRCSRIRGTARALVRPGDPVAAGLRLLRAARPHRRDLALHRRPVAPAHARARLRALRRPRRRLGRVGVDLHGARRSAADDRPAPRQPRQRAVYRAGIARADGRRAGLCGRVRPLAGGGARLRRPAGDQAADPGLRAHRLAGGPGRLDRREVAGLGGHAGRRRPALLARPAADRRHALLGHGHDRDLDA